MRDQDFDAFAALLDDVRSLLPSGQPALSATAKAMFFRALGAYDLSDVRAALDAHVRDPQRGRFAPTPADVIAQLQGAAEDDGRPGAEEAWATALQGCDEAASIVWTAETAEAWGIARHVLAIGDEVGARMAFRETYERLVGEARAARRSVEWAVSLGFDPQQRAAAIAQAVAAGRLPAPALQALPAPDGADLLVGDSSGMPPHVREKLAALAERLRAQGDAPSVDELARADTQRRKDAAAAAVQGYAERIGRAA